MKKPLGILILLITFFTFSKNVNASYVPANDCLILTATSTATVVKYADCEPDPGKGVGLNYLDLFVGAFPSTVASTTGYVNPCVYLNSGITGLNLNGGFAGTLPDGEYWCRGDIYTPPSTPSSDFAFMSFFVNGGVWTKNESSNVIGTSIVFISPHDFEIVPTTTPTTLQTSVYIREDDLTDDMYVRLRYVRNQDLQVAVADTDLLWTVIDFPGPLNATYNVFSTTTNENLIEGQYTIEVSIRDQSMTESILEWFGLGGVFGNSIITSSSTQFIAGAQTSFDEFVEEQTNQLNGFFASSTISVSDIKSYCSFSTNFSFVDCIQSLFIPNTTQLGDALNTARNGFLSRFPIGYLNDFVTIVSTSTIGSLPIIDATLPFFGNPHIHLDATHAVDFVLNATTSQYTNISASSTETFYEITSRYWKILLYLLAIMYIIGRIIGSHLIPNIQKKHDNIHSN